MIVRRYGGGLGRYTVTSRSAMSVANAKAKSSRKAPHLVRAVELPWIKERGGRSVGADARNLDVRSGVRGKGS